MVNLDQLFRQSDPAVLIICAQLHAHDLFALEMTNRTIRRLIIAIFWRHVKNLILYSSESPLNPLSIEKTHSAQIIDNKKIEQLLIRCPNLLRLDFNAWRCGWLPFNLRRKEIEFVEEMPNKMFKDEESFGWVDDVDDENEGNDREKKENSSANDLIEKKQPMQYFYMNDPIRIQSVPEATILVKNITTYCQCLHLLDLSYIPLSGQLLVALSSRLGHSLKILRLIGCFRMPTLSGRIDYSGNPPIISPDYKFSYICPEEFVEFLQNLRNLNEMNLANNELKMLTDTGHNHDAIFSASLKELKFLDTTGTKVAASRLVEALEMAPNLSELHCDMYSEMFDNFEINSQFFAKIASLQHFWLWIHHSQNGQINLPKSRTMCTLRLWFKYQLEVEIGFGKEQKWDSSVLAPIKFDQEGPLPNLKQLYLSWGGKFVVSQLLNNIIVSCPRIKPSNLVCLYVSYQMSTEFNDSLLNAVAEKCPQLEHIKLFEGAEQMTDRLLERIEAKCNDRIRRKNQSPHHAELFYFLRVNAELFWPELESADSQVRLYRDESNGQRQSETKNLYFGIVYRENERRKDLTNDMEQFAWPTIDLVL